LNIGNRHRFFAVSRLAFFFAADFLIAADSMSSRRNQGPPRRSTFLAIRLQGITYPSRN
jgi:hypothetical protein